MRHRSQRQLQPPRSRVETSSCRLHDSYHDGGRKLTVHQTISRSKNGIRLVQKLRYKRLVPTSLNPCPLNHARLHHTPGKTPQGAHPSSICRNPLLTSTSESDSRHNISWGQKGGSHYLMGPSPSGIKSESPINKIPMIRDQRWRIRDTRMERLN